MDSRMKEEALQLILQKKRIRKKNDKTKIV